MSENRDPLSYRDIKQIVLDRIRDQTWKADALLPSETDLADEFSSTRTTVNRALRELAEEGYLLRKRKAGTRVARAPIRHARFAIPLIRDEVEATGAEYRYFLLSSDRVAAPDWLAGRLHLPVGAAVRHLKCMHYAGNKPFQLEDRWIVEGTVPDAAKTDFRDVGPNEWLVQTVPVTDVELTFFAAKADQDMAELLETSPDEAIFAAERVTWHKDNPVTLARLFFPPGYRMTARI